MQRATSDAPHATGHRQEQVTGCPVNLDDVDLFSPGAQEYWFDSYKILHDEAPIHKIPGEGAIPGSDAYILTKYDDIAMVVRDPETFEFYNAAEGDEAAQEIFREKGFGTITDTWDTLRPNLEEHKRHRMELTDPWVALPAAERHTPMITKAANDLMDKWIEKGEVELVKAFAAPLPQIVITTILGFPLEDMGKTRIWEEEQVKRFVYGFSHKNLLTPEQEKANAEALVAFQHYIGEQIEDKRQNPKDDMITFLLNVEYGPEKRRLTDPEIASVVYGMHIGGNETTQYALTAEAMLLAQQPDLVEELRADRTKVRFFVEEALRLYAPTQGLSTRVVMKDIELRGVEIPRGSMLHLRYGAANRDPDLCPATDSIDLTRKNPGRHLTFSMGPRVCPGAGLSRLEQNIA
ncbi:MAG: cytochrome P450, partial [Dehalococcoidia bacterium]|nr:cytochrome P450 [Dehalococcoidia bacterium]